MPMQIISISALFVACKVHDRARSADTFVRAAWDVLCAAALKSDMEKNRELARLNDPVRSILTGICHGPYTSALLVDRVLNVGSMEATRLLNSCMHAKCLCLLQHVVSARSRQTLVPECPRLTTQHMVQELVNQLVSSVLAGERAIFYALNFDLQPYKVHDLVMELSDGGLDKSFCASPQGRNLFKTAWETVVFGCGLTASLLACLSTRPVFLAVAPYQPSCRALSAHATARHSRRHCPAVRSASL